MGFQSTVRLTQGYLIPGDKAYEGPTRVFPYNLLSTPQENVVGSTAYTIIEGATDNSAGVAGAGGTGIYAGILVNSKDYALYGNGTYQGALAPTLVLPDGVVGQLATMGYFALLLTTAANPGDLLTYDTTTGALASVPSDTTFAASAATTVLTVTGTPTGFVGPGMELGAPFVPGTIITANGTGTGGAGTYTLNISQTVAAGTYAGSAVAPTGYALVPNAKVVLRSSAANGVAICELTD